MSAVQVIAIFDVGKTNKKLFLFNEKYEIVFERSARFSETVDEDGFPCENQESLRQSVFDSLNEVSRLKAFDIKAVNFSAYGASFVYTGDDGQPLTPLYNYLKPFPEALSDKFYKAYGGQVKFSLETASPVLGSLNSGLQLYRMKQEQPWLFDKVKYALHLPQYLSFLLTGLACSDITSIGCHTALWDFQKNQYHKWVEQEHIAPKLAPIVASDTISTAVFNSNKFKIGTGLHDSSAALIPYLINFHEPFVLISTGTWCISLNPFNDSPLTSDELKNDCLCYLQFQGKPVKASRLFSGFEYEQMVKHIATHFNTDEIKYRSINFDSSIIQHIKTRPILPQNSDPSEIGTESIFKMRDMADFKNDIEAYHQLMMDMVQLQAASTNLVLKSSPVKRIFVDGGFSKNCVYMNLLAAVFPQMEVFAASMAQASAIGAALSIHREWNNKPIPNDIIGLKYYSGQRNMIR